MSISGFKHLEIQLEILLNQSLVFGEVMNLMMKLKMQMRMLQVLLTTRSLSRLFGYSGSSIFS